MKSIPQSFRNFTVDFFQKELLGTTIGGFIDETQALFNDFLLSYLMDFIREIDTCLLEASEARKDWHVVKSSVERTLETKAGTLQYTRRYYRNQQTKEYKYLTDELLGVRAYDRLEDHLKLALIEAATRVSYREASATVCIEPVSATAVMNSVREIRLPKQVEQVPRRRVEELHIQADEDHVHLQQQKKKSAQIRFAAIHEPKERVGKKRYKLTNRHILSSVKERPEDFGERLLERIDARYDLDHLKRIYVHGDGASWIARVQESIPHCTAILDHFHLEKALLSVCKGSRRLRSRLRSCLNPWDEQALTEELQMLIDSDVCTQQQADKLRVYLQNNQAAITANFELDHGGSCAEGLVSHVFSKRFSRNPLAWSIQSLQALSETRVHLENGETLTTDMLDGCVEAIEELKPILSAAKAKVKRKISDEHVYWDVQIPGSERTSGAIGAIIKRLNNGGYIC